MADHGCIKTGFPGRCQFCLGFAAAAAAAFLFLTGSILTNYRVVHEERPKAPGEGSLAKSAETTQLGATVYKVDEKKLFSFIPAENCDSLFKHGTDLNLNFSGDYFINKVKFDVLLNKVLKGKPFTNGHIGVLREQSLAYFLWAKATFVKTICETGFNAGHSALIFLSANPNVKVYSFDIGGQGHSIPMANFMQETFKGRFKMTWGNSMSSVPAFIKANPDVKCDIISIDGGHDYKTCKADLRNLRPLARKKYHVLLIDDYPLLDKYLPVLGVKKAWKEELKKDQVQEHFKCQFHSQTKRGFTVGKYINL